MAHILIAEDDINVSGLIGRFLTRFGHTTQVAHDGIAALECLSAGPCDLLITDLNLPRLSGADLLRQIKASQPLLPVVLCSGQDASPEEAALVDRVLGKPFGVHDLMAVLGELLPHSS